MPTLLRRYAAACALIIVAGAADAQTPRPETDRWGLTASDYSMIPGARLALRAGFPARYKEALAAADSGDVSAMTLVGIAHHQGVGAPKDPARASVWSRRAADAGNPRAMNTLGVMYTVGWGVVKNDLEAVRWLRTAMQKGNAIAQLNMAIRYGNGNGVPKSVAASLDLTRRAADQGYDNAQHALGSLHHRGEHGLVKNPDSALVWFRRAAEQDHPGASYSVGLAYYNGNGVLGDYEQAAQWFERSRELEYSWGALALASMYEQGRGVPMDSARGRALLKEAADANNTSAYTRLSRRYLLGQGETRDLQQALSYAQRAVAGKNDNGHYWEAYAYYYLGKRPEAFASMRRAEAANVNGAKDALTEWQRIADNEALQRQQQQQRRQAAAVTQQEKKKSGGGLMRGVLGAGVGALAAAAHGADAEQTVGAMAVGVATFNPQSAGAQALGAAGQKMLTGSASPVAGASGRASYPTKPNLAQGAHCPGFTMANYSTRAFQGGGDTQLYTMCGQAFEYYKAYLNAIRKGYSEADANKTYSAHAASARTAQSFFRNAR